MELQTGAIVVHRTRASLRSAAAPVDVGAVRFGMMRPMPRPAAAFRPLPALLLLACAAAGAAEPSFDPARCLGRWHVLARTPAADDGCRSLEFTRSGPAWSERCLDPAGEPQPLDPDDSDPRRWRTETGLLTDRSRRFLYVSPDYRLAAVGDGGDGLTLMAREPAIAEWHYAGLVARAALQGYDVGALKKEGPARGRP